MPAILPMVPGTFENYIEPFAGGCALLVELYNLGRIRHAIISDLNGELINLYTVVRNSPGKLISEIAALPFGNSSISYYSARERFNGILGLRDSMIERAALFLYLNRHGYNGLWRVNSSGKFNVPFGRYRNPAMPDPDHITAFSRMLFAVSVTGMKIQLLGGYKFRGIQYGGLAFAGLHDVSCLTVTVPGFHNPAR